MTRRQMLTLALTVEAGMGVLAIGVALLLSLPVVEWVQPGWTGFGWGLLGGLVLLGVLLLCQKFPLGPIGKLMRFVDTTVKPLFGECRTIDLLVISLLAGVGEELLFRGWIGGMVGPVGSAGSGERGLRTGALCDPGVRRFRDGPGRTAGMACDCDR